MEWEFTPEDVVKGISAYGLTEFRRDLGEEVRQNMGGDAASVTRAYNLLYDLCYALATEKDIEAHLAAYAWDPPTVQFLREMRPVMAGNAQMLGAILQRMIMNRVEAGMPLAQAVDEAAREHEEAVGAGAP